MTGPTRQLSFALVATAVLGLGACDPVHASAVDALGGETRGVPRGPLHRPGQPCTVCHDGALGDPQAFSIAGTIFLLPSDLQGVEGASVVMTDSTGSRFTTSPTNAAGNFYVSPSEWTPTYPIKSTIVCGSTDCSGGQVATMYTLIGWSGSCAGCHFDPPGPGSAGHISMQLDDGGTPL